VVGLPGWFNEAMESFITLISTRGYLPGVIALGRSLRASGTRRPLVVAVAAGIGAAVESALKREGLQTVRLPPAIRPAGLKQSGSHHWSNTFDKLHLFGLTQFRKLVYLDSDMMVLSRIDELFDWPHMAAVAAGRFVHPDWVRLNSGLMVIEPRAGLPGEIVATLPTALREASQDGDRIVGDQDLINAYYPEWPASRLQLDEGYNMLHPLVDHYIASGRYTLDAHAVDPGRSRLIKVIHFIGSAKPWSLRGMLRHAMARCRGEVLPMQRRTFEMYRRLLRGSAGTFAPA